MRYFAAVRRGFITIGDSRRRLKLILVILVGKFYQFRAITFDHLPFVNYESIKYQIIIKVLEI